MTFELQYCLKSIKSHIKVNYKPLGEPVLLFYAPQLARHNEIERALSQWEASSVPCTHPVFHCTQKSFDWVQLPWTCNCLENIYNKMLVVAHCFYFNYFHFNFLPVLNVACHEEEPAVASNFSWWCSGMPDWTQFAFPMTELKIYWSVTIFVSVWTRIFPHYFI